MSGLSREPSVGARRLFRQGNITSRAFCRNGHCMTGVSENGFPSVIGDGIRLLRSAARCAERSVNQDRQIRVVPRRKMIPFASFKETRAFIIHPQSLFAKGEYFQIFQERMVFMKLNGSDVLVECLLEQGVDTVFGYPGGAVLNIYDALYKYRDRINHILTAHEQGASHAADGYARATGRVGVCIATSGPGATNLVTGIATAYMDSIPMVAITGNVAVSLLGRDSFQEVDITGITMPITKHNFIVKRVEELADTVRQAFCIAQSGRPVRF